MSQLVRVPANVFAESMRDLNDSAKLMMTAPFHGGNGKTVRACKLESICFQLTHTSQVQIFGSITECIVGYRVTEYN